MPGKSSPNRLIMGTTPDVETVMRRFDICDTERVNNKAECAQRE